MTSGLEDAKFFHEKGFGLTLGFGRMPALIVIDLINAFTNPDLPLGCDLETQIEGTNKLLDTAHQARIPVIFSTVAYEGKDLEDAGLWPLKHKGSITLSRSLKNSNLGLIFSMLAAMTRGERGDSRRGMRGIGPDIGSYLTPQTDSSRCSQKFWDANEIVGRCAQDEEPFHQIAPAMSGLAQTADRLDPAEAFFDPLALDCADAIAGMPRGARING